MAEENTTNNQEQAADRKEDKDWADAIKVRGGEEDGGDSKILNQEEIDSLFGYTPDEEDEDYEMKTGVRAILNASMVSYERLPMLDIVFDRLIRMMATSLRNFTQDNVEVSLDNIESMRFGEYIDSLTLPTLLAVFKAEEWDNYGLMSVDSSLVYSIVDVLLGGRRGTAAMRIEGRPYTTIELNLVKDMIELILSDLSTSFDPVTSVNFAYDRLETNPRFATITRLSNAVIVAHLRIDMEDRGAAANVHGRTLRPRYHLGKPPDGTAVGNRCRNQSHSQRADDKSRRNRQMGKRVFSAARNVLLRRRNAHLRRRSAA